MADDLGIELIERRREIEASSNSIDSQEIAEREDAARALAREDEAHFVDYAMDCINASVKAHENIRRIQGLCWDVYEENEPPSYMDKEEWQARTVVPKPFSTVQFGAAAIKKAFSPDFLSIQKPKDKKKAQFWQKVMEHYLDESHARFVLRFTDAVVMALAVGSSMEMLPLWTPNVGLEFVLVEPWKIQRDPDALSREPQSGLYWIHQEWLDYHVLKQGEADGKYVDVDRVKDTTENQQDPLLNKQAIEARKKMIHQRSEFRQSFLTSEFWGMVLDKQGNVLLPSATYTISTNRLIQLPEATPDGYRWPGTGFSPVPHLLRFDGRGLLEGVLSIWEAWNNILCLHQDYLQWVVNPPREINVDALDDPRDSNIYPGKDILVRDTANGQQAVRLEQRRSRTSDVLANEQYYGQLFSQGSMVTSQVQGLPGWRKEEPYRLAAMNLDQALGVFGLMGSNVEAGAIDAITLAAKTVKAMAGYEDYEEIFTADELKEYGVAPDPEGENGVTGVPAFDGTFHVSGIQALMRDNETLTNLREVIIPLSREPRYASYINPHKVLRAIEIRTNLEDEGVIATTDEAKLIDYKQELAAAEQQDAVKKMQDLQEAMGIAELAKAVDEITTDIQELGGQVNALMNINPAERGGANNEKGT